MTWPLVRLESLIAETRNGLYKHADFYGRGTAILKMFNLQKGQLDLDRVDRVELDPEELSAYRLRPGDILMNRVNTPELVGKCAVIPAELGEAVFESKNIRIRLRGDLADSRFVASYLNSPFGRPSLCQGVKHAIGMATINNGDVRNCSVPLPALKEQRRIVELLEQADGLRRMREEADMLADRILPALFNHCFGEPTSNPKGWPTSALNELADFVSGATPSKESAAFWNGTIPWVSPKDMKQQELYDSIDHVSKAALAETNLKLLPRDTALIVVRGMILAHTVPVCLARVPVSINQDMKGLLAKGDVTAEFLQWALLAQHSALLRLVTTAAHGTRKLDTDALGNLEIPVPPPPQRDLIKKWTGMVREQQAAARKRVECRASIEQIWRTMLHRAFTGELTAKWREAQMKELLAEMEQQARLLKRSLVE